MIKLQWFGNSRPWFFWEPIKRGRPPIDDSVHINAAIEGKWLGKYKTAEQAAYEIALSAHPDDEYKSEALRKRIVPKLSGIFS